MKKLIILLVLTFSYLAPVLPIMSQDKDSVYGVEGVDYAKGEVVIVFSKEKFCLLDFLKGVEKRDSVLKTENALLESLGIKYPLISFMKHSNLVLVKAGANSNESVVEMISRIKATSKIKISDISPRYYIKAETSR